MSAKDKEVRAEWEVKLIGAHQGLLKIFATAPVQKRAIKRILDELESIWEKLVKSHSQYCLIANAHHLQRGHPSC